MIQNQMRNTKVINLFGNPGSGKSTTASYLFTELKKQGKEVEWAFELAKELVWEEDFDLLKNQVFVFAAQMYRIDRLYGKVDYIVTDSPLMLKVGFYKCRNLPAPKHFKKLVQAYVKRYNNINIYLKSINKKVSQIGRAEMDLNPMKYLSSMPYDLITDYTKNEEILNFILNYKD